MARRFGSLARLLTLTAPPLVHAEGDIWYRSDRDQVRASDGNSGEPLTIGPAGNAPTIRSGAWHNFPPYGNAAALNIPLDRLWAIPFYPGQACRVAAMAVNVTTALAGADLRYGLYSSDGVLPNRLLDDYGTVSAASTGTKTITPAGTNARPVLNFLVVARQGAAGTLAVSSRSSWSPYVCPTSAVITANHNAYYIDGVSGALPVSFGAPAGTEQGPCTVAQLN
jgi:hypothetical protein